jgi:hypothetical protein
MWQPRLLELPRDSSIPTQRPPSLGCGVLRIRVHCADCHRTAEKGCTGDVGALDFFELFLRTHHAMPDPVIDRGGSGIPSPSCSEETIEIYEKPQASNFGGRERWYVYVSDWWRRAPAFKRF